VALGRSVCLSVGRSVSWLAVQRVYCVLHWGGDRRREGTVLGVNVGHPIVTNGDFVARLYFAMRVGNAALPKLL